MGASKDEPQLMTHVQRQLASPDRGRLPRVSRYVAIPQDCAWLAALHSNGAPQWVFAGTTPVDGHGGRAP
jgi:hypothetical protein